MLKVHVWVFVCSLEITFSIPNQRAWEKQENVSRLFPNCVFVSILVWLEEMSYFQVYSHLNHAKILISTAFPPFSLLIAATCFTARLHTFK